MAYARRSIRGEAIPESARDVIVHNFREAVNELREARRGQTPESTDTFVLMGGADHWLPVTITIPKWPMIDPHRELAADYLFSAAEVYYELAKILRGPGAKKDAMYAAHRVKSIALKVKSGRSMTSASPIRLSRTYLKPPGEKPEDGPFQNQGV